jgi:hypothetical protein
VADGIFLLQPLEAQWHFGAVPTGACRKERVKKGRNTEPSVGIMDAKSVKTTQVAGEARGFDAGKKN